MNLRKEGNLVETGQLTQILFHSQKYNLKGKYYFVNGPWVHLYNQKVAQLKSCLHPPLQTRQPFFSLKVAPFRWSQQILFYPHVQPLVSPAPYSHTLKRELRGIRLY